MDEERQGIEYLIGLRSHMSLGERAAIEGILQRLRPRLAVEIGTAEGWSLRQIAAHADEVHSFDFDEPALETPPNARIHTGDSHEHLPQVLAELAAERRNVDFALVDGDHTADGVRRDVEDLLNSPAVSRTLILAHDTASETVRAGLTAIAYGDWPKINWVDLDFLPGFLFRDPAHELEIWGGLAMVIVDDSAPRPERPLLNETVFASSEVLAESRERRRRTRPGIRSRLEGFGRRLRR